MVENEYDDGGDPQVPGQAQRRNWARARWGYQPTEMSGEGYSYQHQGVDPTYNPPQDYQGPQATNNQVVPDPAPQATNNTQTPQAATNNQPSSPASPVTATGQIVPAGPTSGQYNAPAYQPPPQLGAAPTYQYQPPSGQWTVQDWQNWAAKQHTPTQFTQFQGPNQGATQDATNALLMRVLQNPESLGPQVVAQLKEQQKEQALAMQQQALEQFGQNAASRGMADWGGVGANERRMADATIGNILQGQRGIDISAAQTNMQDRLNALAASEAAMTGQMGRATSGYGATLAGQQAQEQANQFGAGNELQRRQLALQQALAGDNRDLNYNQLNEQARQFNANYGLNSSQLGEGARQFDIGDQRSRSQFDKNYALALMEFLNNAQMGRYNLGMGYAGLQNQFMNYLGGLA